MIEYDIQINFESNFEIEFDILNIGRSYGQLREIIVRKYFIVATC